MSNLRRINARSAAAAFLIPRDALGPQSTIVTTMRITFVTALVLLGASGCMSSAPPPQPMTALALPTATDWPTAKRNLEVALRRSLRPGPWYRTQEPIKSLRIRPDHFSFIDTGVARSDVTGTRRDEPYSMRRVFRFASMGQPQLQGSAVLIQGTRNPTVQLPGSGPLVVEWFFFPTRAEANAFATALREAYAAAQTVTFAEQEFEQQAVAWRAANPRPALSATAERHKVLAEAAARDRNFELAIEHFEAALETDPTWPSGNFNLALLYEEAEDWGEAMRYMRRFLLLEPNSREAPAARQKLIIWEDRASREASP